MSRTLVAAGTIRAGRVTVAPMRVEVPVRVEGDATAIAGAVGQVAAVRRLDEVAFASYVDRLVAVGAPVAVYTDGSYRRA